MGTLLKYLLVGVAAIIAIKVALAIIGMAIGLTMFALIVGGPIALVGYVIYKLTHRNKSKYPEISESDRKWLES